MKFVVIPELKGRWIWELRSPEGVPFSRSPGSFASKEQALTAIEAVKRAVSSAGVYDLVGVQLDDKG